MINRSPRLGERYRSSDRQLEAHVLEERSRFAMRHALVLMAAVACGLAINRQTMPDFRTWSDMGKQIMTATDYGLLLVLPHVLTLTIAVPILYCLDGTFTSVKTHHDVGLTVALVATVTILVMTFLVSLWTMTEAYWADRDVVLLSHSDAVAVAVLACRFALWDHKRTGPSLNWCDTLGRALGWIWVAAFVLRSVARSLPYLV